MLLVALTGGIATGKSVVADVFQQLGCYIHEADLVAHQLIAPEKPAWKAIVGHFGEQILNPDKTINRRSLGAVIFKDEAERHFLNKILHPMVLEKKREIVERLEKTDKYKIFVSVAALTIEAGFTGFFDKIIVVYCDRETQAKRLMERDGLNEQEAKKRIKSQMPPEEKLTVADYIINTSGTLAETVEQAEHAFRNLMIDYALKVSENKNGKHIKKKKP